jgi:hypothetical protein
MVLPTQKMLDEAARVRPGEIINDCPIGFQAMLLDLGFRNALLQA